MPPNRGLVSLPAILAAVGVVYLFWAGKGNAGVIGSPHDLSPSNTQLYSTSPIATGPCVICHTPHNSLYNGLWPRDLLSTYDNALQMNGGTGSTDKPNYKRPVTIQCYDCHDAHKTTTKINDYPAFDNFVTSHKPQNIAFGFTKQSPGDSGSTMLEDGPGPTGTVAGYYENNPPFQGAASTYYGADTSFRRPLDNATLAKTGGHYFKTQDPASGSVYKGDKLPCSECHEPHSWKSDWQAFFLPLKLYGYPSRSGRWTQIFGSSNPVASTFMANPVASGAYTQRRDVDSRKMCILCHGDSDTILAVTFNDINSDYSSTVMIVRPPATIGEHANSSQIACVSCHNHNIIGANCSQCHGFPPSSTANPIYPSTTASRFVPSPAPAQEDSHAKHWGGRSGETRNSLAGYVYRFDCGNCHYGSALGIDSSLQHHQNSFVSVVLLGGWTAAPNGPGGAYDNTNYYNASAGHSGAGQLDNSNGATGWGDGTRYGGNSCRNVYCHSVGRRPSTMVAGDNTSYRQDVAWNSGPQHCNDCHGRGTDNASLTYGMPNYAGGTVGSDTANSHNAHVVKAGIECSVCHSTTVTGTGANRAIRTDIIPSNHVDNVRQVVFDGVNASGTYGDTPATKTCLVSCHNNALNLRWGGPPQNCDSCHLRAGDVDDFGNGTQPSMTRNGITAGIDNNEWNWSGHGRDSGQYDVSLNPAANLRGGGGSGTNKCAFCHDPAVPHDNATNPFRLANFNTFTQGWNGACYVCHASASIGNSAPGYAPAADNSGNYVAKTATQKVGSNHYNPGSASNARHSTANNGGKFCYDCHDPHGDRNSSGVGNIFMIGKRVSMRTDNVYGIPVNGNDNSNRPAATFTNNVNGIDYASTDNVGSFPFTKVCETCHEAATGILHYTRAGRLDSTHFTSKCVTCHTHDGGFRGLGGPDVGQFFDRTIQAAGPLNFADNSSHPLIGLTDGTGGSLLYASQGSVNCLGCHYASGPARTSDECLKCHFENVDGSQGRHMDKAIQLTSITGNGLPTSQFTINTIVDYDNWCLQCHGSESGITLGGISPLNSRRTVINPAAFAAGRHRAQSPQVGCIYCHAPHGSGNARLVRINPANRGSAGPTPMEFGVFPSDNSGTYTGNFQAAPNEVRPYRARVDNTLPNVFADADDENSFCNKACHLAKVSANFVKDKVIKRDGGTGNYLITSGNKKIYLINGGEYTNDNIATFFTNPHVHPNGDIIDTDNMVKDYANLIGLTGPPYYHYPNLGGAAPGTYTIIQNAASPLPYFPDFGDGTRDFNNAWNNLGVPVKYRYTCSTCHNPHGTTDTTGNTPGGTSHPDLRLPKTSITTNTICNQCHK